ncbi:probable purine permease 5 isoform X2 [Ananas comosus]|uniref:Probable purine permease n=1 Tax=Ananas comosus TaxID=4615 RepID=A0A6P5G348_ANACO|nr:probable purine permease 5 isoform X2 [Ananas comosus]
MFLFIIYYLLFILPFPLLHIPPPQVPHTTSMDNKEEDAPHNQIQPQDSSAASAASSLCEKITELTSSVLETFRRKPVSYRILLVLSSAAMLTAFPASSLLSRLYYSDGGQSKWIISWAAVAGWPLTALFLIPAYFANRISPTPLSLKLLAWYILLGFLSAADNLMFAWAYAYLPASTASLLAASSLVFSSLFGYFIVKNRINLASVNAIVIITAGVVVIALDARSDRYEGITDKQYTLGFVWDILGSALHGLIFALSELVFIKVLGRRSFHVVLEQQVMVSFAAFAFTTLGLVVQKGFAEMRSEAERFARGGSSYAQVLFWAAVTFQLGVLGGTGVLFLASTVFAGVLNAVRVPLTSIAAVVLFQDPMSGFKILSLVITVWGFGSYIVGHSSANKPS